MRPLFASKTRSISSRLRDALSLSPLRCAAPPASPKPSTGLSTTRRRARAEAAAAGVAAQGRRVDAAARRADARRDQRALGERRQPRCAAPTRARSLERLAVTSAFVAQRRQLRGKLQHVRRTRARSRACCVVSTGGGGGSFSTYGLRLNAPLLDDALGLDDRRPRRAPRARRAEGRRRRSLPLDNETRETLRNFLRLVDVGSSGSGRNQTSDRQHEQRAERHAGDLAQALALVLDPVDHGSS